MITREDALNLFLAEEVSAISNELFIELDKQWVKEIQSLSNMFQNSFLESCNNLKKMQQTGDANISSYIIFTILRTNIQEKEYSFPFIHFDELLWLGNKQIIIGQHSCDFFFYYYEKLKNNLINAVKKYPKLLIFEDIDKILQKELEKFLRYFAKLAKYNMKEYILSKEYKSVVKSPFFQFRTGEYMGETYLVFDEDTIESNIKNEIYSLAKQEYKLCDKTIRNIDFSFHNMSESDFVFTRFQNCSFFNTDMQYGRYIGTSFSGCDCRDTNFSYSVMNEADFSNANLENACLKKIEAYSGFTVPSKWDMPSFWPINFSRANLTNVNFSGADLRGAIFDNAICNNTKFSNIQLNYLSLSDQQMQSILRIEE